MREIYSNPEHARVGYFRSILADAGIECFIRNENDNNNMTGVIFTPILCISQDEDYDQAVALLKDRMYALEEAGEDWKCPKCQEEVPGGFEICWSCQSERPGLA